jgi:cell division protein FtsQ
VAAWGVSRSALLDVDHIEVDGASRVPVEDILAAGGIERGDPLVDIDLGRAQAGIAGLAWVESVEVHRSWWGTVRYEITERQPTVVVHTSEATGPAWLVDRGGWVLAPATPDDHATLPRIDGVPVADAGTRLDGVGRVAVELAGLLTPGLAAWVESIEVDADGELWLRLRSDSLAVAGGFGADPGLVRLGDGRDARAQVLAAETLLARVDLSCLAVIDVRVASAPVVTRADGCLEGTPA